MDDVGVEIGIASAVDTAACEYAEGRASRANEDNSWRSNIMYM